MTRVASRAAARSADPDSLETRARPVVPFPGPAAARSTPAPGRAGVARYVSDRRRSASAAASVARSAAMRPCARHYGSTRMARVVPRTPTIAAGVSRRMESGASFAIRPETYAATPRTNLQHHPEAAARRARTRSVRGALRCSGPSETRVSSFNVTPTARRHRFGVRRPRRRPVRACAGIVAPVTHDERGAGRNLDVSRGRRLLGQHRCCRREYQREDAAPPSRIGHGNSYDYERRFLEGVRHTPLNRTRQLRNCQRRQLVRSKRCE